MCNPTGGRTLKLSNDTLARDRPQKGQLSLPMHLPETKRRGDVCRFCYGVHMNVADFIACREANT